MSMSWSPAAGRSDLEQALRRLGSAEDEEIDLAGSALVLAALDAPEGSLDHYLHHLSLIERDVAEAADRLGDAETLETRLEALRRTLFDKYGYQGDEESYDDLDNANLMRVIDRRRGLPIALSILYIHAARAQGWPVAGVSFPGHFLVRLDGEGARALVDPFNGGVTREPAELRDLLKAVAGAEAELEPQHYAPSSNRDILLRLQNNIKMRLLQDDQPAEALKVLETMLMIAPSEGHCWREAGALHAHLGNLRAAIMSLEQALELVPEDEARHQTAQLLQDLRTRLN
jgi:regulator of sirC expression with transglutaminase-like and TPR domain